MICGSIDVVVQAARLRDGSRRITHITEVIGMEGDVIITQDLFIYDMVGEDAWCAPTSQVWYPSALCPQKESSTNCPYWYSPR